MTSRGVVGPATSPPPAMMMMKPPPPSASSPLPVVVAEKEAEIILPPATSLNPIPKLPAALRMDNQEQIVSLLKTNPTGSSNPNFRQLLVFASESLRTLIMRQVLCDPNLVTKQSSTLQKGMKTKKNWDEYNVFPNLPRGLTVVGTSLFQSPSSSSTSSPSLPFLSSASLDDLPNNNNNNNAANSGAAASPRIQITTAATAAAGDAAVLPTPEDTELRLQGSSWDMSSSSANAAASHQYFFSNVLGMGPEFNANNVDVITYFLRPYDLIQTQHIIKIIRSYNKLHNNNRGLKGGAAGIYYNNLHHRIVYIPQPTALVSKMLTNYLGTNIFTSTAANTNNKIMIPAAVSSTMSEANDNTANSSNNKNVSIQQLQLDLFPLENDILSLEMEDTIKELHIEGTPSNMVTTIARSICKLQDITGKIPRIQTIGPLAEEILRKYLALTVDEYLVSEKSLDSDTIMNTMMNHQNQQVQAQQQAAAAQQAQQQQQQASQSAAATNNNSANTSATNDTSTHSTNTNTTTASETVTTTTATLNENSTTTGTTTTNPSMLNDDTIDHNHQAVACGDIAAMIIMDRKVDMVTPMVSPLTYEGLLDEIVGIDCGFIQVDVNTINPEEEEESKKKEDEAAAAAAKAKKKKSSGSSSNPFEDEDDDDDDKKPSSNPFSDDEASQTTQSKKKQPPVSLGVNGSDTLYTEVRDQHVEKFGSFLQNQAMALRESHANFTNKGKKKDLSEIHQFVKQIPIFTQNLRSLTNHIHLAELIKAITEETTFRERWVLERSMIEGDICYDNIEDLIACRQYDNPYSLLRLLCLQSLTSGGIKSSRYDTFKRDIIQTYGYEYLFVLGNLEKVGLLRRRETIWMDTTSPFNNLRKSLILVNAEVDTVEPDDVSYVSSGYAPLSIRLIQASVQQGWLKQNNNNTYTDIINQLILSENPGGSGGSGNVMMAGATSGTISHVSQQRFIIDITQQYPPEDYASSLRRSQIQQQQVQQLQQSSSQQTQSQQLHQQQLQGQQQQQQQQQPSSAAAAAVSAVSSAVAAGVTSASSLSSPLGGPGGGGSNSSSGNPARTKLLQQLSGGGPYSSLASVVASAADDNTRARGKKPTMMVFFVGGVTYMEIAAMRFLSKRPSFPYHIVCCTTKVINGNTFLQSLS